MIVMMSLFWGAVIFAGVMLFRGTDSRSGRESARTRRPTYRDPVDILGERFARGELENEEYEARTPSLSAPNAELSGFRHIARELQRERAQHQWTSADGGAERHEGPMSPRGPVRRRRSDPI